MIFEEIDNAPLSPEQLNLDEINEKVGQFDNLSFGRGLVIPVKFSDVFVFENQYYSLKERKIDLEEEVKQLHISRKVEVLNDRSEIV